jgi:hypothetical protein
MMKTPSTLPKSLAPTGSADLDISLKLILKLATQGDPSPNAVQPVSLLMGLRWALQDTGTYALLRPGLRDELDTLWAIMTDTPKESIDA